MDVELSRKQGLEAPCQEMILASHPLMLLQHYGLPVIVALNRFGSDTEREFEMIRKHLGEQASPIAIVQRAALRAGLRHPRFAGEPSDSF
jgi:hypothetical protein